MSNKMEKYKKIFRKTLIKFILFASCIPKHGDKQDIILPEDYTGWFAIVYNCKCGEEKKFVDGRVQQIIPENGILLVNYPRKKGLIDIRFYYQTKSGKKFITDIKQKNDSIILATFNSKLAFNGKSMCSDENEFFKHEILYFYFNIKKDSSMFSHHLNKKQKQFEDKLIIYLKKENKYND